MLFLSYGGVDSSFDNVDGSECVRRFDNEHFTPD